MLSKCANPGCSRPFRYLHQGKLFRMETEVGDNERSFGSDPDVKKHRRLEFFWLCEECALKMTLAFQKGAGVIVKPMAPKVRVHFAA